MDDGCGGALPGRRSKRGVMLTRFLAQNPVSISSLSVWVYVIDNHTSSSIMISFIIRLRRYARTTSVLRARSASPVSTCGEFLRLASADVRCPRVVCVSGCVISWMRCLVCGMGASSSVDRSRKCESGLASGSPEWDGEICIRSTRKIFVMSPRNESS